MREGLFNIASVLLVGAQTTLTRDGYLVPMWALLDQDGMLRLVAITGGHPSCGAHLIHEEPRPVAWVIVSDAYTATTEPSVAAAIAAHEQYGGVANMPGRQEAIVIVAVGGESGAAVMLEQHYNRVAGRIVLGEVTVDRMPMLSPWMVRGSDPRNRGH